MIRLVRVWSDREHSVALVTNTRAHRGNDGERIGRRRGCQPSRIRHPRILRPVHLEFHQWSPPNPWGVNLQSAPLGRAHQPEGGNRADSCSPFGSGGRQNPWGASTDGTEANTPRIRGHPGGKALVASWGPPPLSIQRQRADSGAFLNSSQSGSPRASLNL